MNLLDIDIKEYAQDIIDAYVEVYGERHRDIITQRFNRILYIIYNNAEGMDYYVHYLEKCKKRELSLKFLERIGIDISKHKGKNFSEDFDIEYGKILKEYIGRYHLGVELENDVGIMAWSEISKEQDLEILELRKVNFLNFYRGDNCQKITTENFEKFSQTEEYSQILEKIQEYLKIYNELVEEYENYLQSIEPYRKYAKEETKRKEDMKQDRKNEFYKEVFNILPTDIKEFLDDKYKNIEEKYEAFLGEAWECASYVEAFSDEKENVLNNLLGDEFDREYTYLQRIQYFEGMGVEIDKTKIEFATYEEFYKYCITKEDVKKIIPTADFAKEINKLRDKAYKEFEKDFIYTSEDFVKNIQKIADNEGNREAIFERKKINQVCITYGNNEKGFLPVMFYTIRRYDGGALDYSFLHEGCHAIEAEKSIYENGCITGFDIVEEYAPGNPYDQTKRKYERMNETIDDILCMETADILHKKGIYIFEPEEIIAPDIKDRNTSSILKNLLKRFMIRYRDEIIDARIDYSCIRKLYNTIGKENFEELNDLINKVDYLIKYKNLIYKLDNNKIEDPVYIEYNEQLERLEKIYENMEQHKSQSENNRHEGKITMSQLIAAINAKQKESKQNEYDDWGNKI